MKGVKGFIVESKIGNLKLIKKEYEEGVRKEIKDENGYEEKKIELKEKINEEEQYIYNKVIFNIGRRLIRRIIFVLNLYLKNIM